MKKLLAVITITVAMLGCTSSSNQSAQTEKPQPKPAEFVTGRSAFYKLYVAARGWARDAQPYRLQSVITADSKGHDGKAAVWRANFASPSQGSVKPYIWSGTDVSDAPSRGISPGTEDTYSPTNSSTHVFDIAFLKTDSDQAFDVAQKHGGDKILAKTPDTAVFYIADWNPSTNQLVWHVIYGTSREDAKLNVAVNASTGEFLGVEK